MANVLKNNAASDLIAKMYLNEDIADVHFEFSVDDGSQKVPASKNVLGTLSPVFYKMFFGSLKEGSVVKITDADAESFKAFLQFFYLGEVTLTMENIETVVRLADKYDVLEAVGACATFLESQLTMENMCWGYQLATNLKNDELIDFCERIIAVSPKEIFATDGFKRCDRNTLESILKLDLNCKETDDFEACLSWAKHSCKENDLDETKMENLKAQLGDSMKLIRFGTVTVQEFSDFSKSNYGLFTPDEFMDVVYTLTSREYKSEKFNPNRRFPVWNENKALWCRRKETSFDFLDTKYVQTTEVVWFTSNQPVLLGAFFTASTGNRHFINVSDKGIDIKITEIGNDSLKKVLYEGQTKTWDEANLKASITSPIMIEPQVKYEIRLIVPMTSGSAYYYHTIWKPMVQLENGHTIQFHRCPSHASYDTSSSGWIQSLVFNKV